MDGLEGGTEHSNRDQLIRFGRIVISQPAFFAQSPAVSETDGSDPTTALVARTHRVESDILSGDHGNGDRATSQPATTQLTDIPLTPAVGN
jgi:hypothetical protein